MFKNFTCAPSCPPPTGTSNQQFRTWLTSMGCKKSRPRKKLQIDMSTRGTLACSSTASCNNKKPRCSCSCCPRYPEFSLSSSGICYVQCDFCCQIYPCCCLECPNCGSTKAKSFNEPKMPENAFCPCCRQETPKANGLQCLCTPNPCCMCQCACAEREQIAKCLQGSCIETHGKKKRRCCQCKQQQEKKNSRRTCDQNKSKSNCYPVYPSAVLRTCESGTSAAGNSPPQCTDFNCSKLNKTSKRQCETNRKANDTRTVQIQSQRTRAQCCKVEPQRRVPCCACSSKGRRKHCTANNPSVASPCGSEVEIRNITFDLSDCRADDEDDGDEYSCCNK